MASFRAIFLAFTVIIFANQALVSAYDGAGAYPIGNQDGSMDPARANYLRRCIRSLSDEVMALRRSLKGTRRASEIQQGMGMGQMQEGQMHIQIVGSDEDCLPYQNQNGQQPQSPGYPASGYTDPHAVAVPYQPQQIQSPTYPEHQMAAVPYQPQQVGVPAPYPYQQQYPVQGGSPYDHQNPNQAGYYADPSVNQVPYNQPVQTPAAQGNPISLQASFGGHESSNMAVKLNAIRRLLNAHEAGAGSPVA